MFSYDPIVAIQDTESELSRRRDALHNSVASNAGSITMAEKLYAIAELEGRLEVHRAAELVAKRFLGDDDLVGALVHTVAEFMTHQPDDRWYGRINDIRRAQQDGRVAAAAEIMNSVRSSTAEDGEA